MTDLTTIIWLTGITCWLIIGTATTYLMLTSKDREDVEVRVYMSPGAACELWITPIQREVLIRWIGEDVDAPRPLQSFCRQLQRVDNQGWVTVYRRQLDPLSDLVEQKGMISLARELRGGA